MYIIFKNVSYFFQKLRNNLINLSKDPDLALSTFENNLYEALDTATALYEDGYFEPKEGLLLCYVGYILTTQG